MCWNSKFRTRWSTYNNLPVRKEIKPGASTVKRKLLTTPEYNFYLFPAKCETKSFHSKLDKLISEMGVIKLCQGPVLLSMVSWTPVSTKIHQWMHSFLKHCILKIFITFVFNYSIITRYFFLHLLKHKIEIKKNIFLLYIKIYLFKYFLLLHLLLLLLLLLLREFWLAQLFISIASSPVSLFPIFHPQSSSNHSSHRLPILLLVFLSVLLHTVSICIWSWPLFHWSFFLHVPTSSIVCNLNVLLV